jgi:cell shape-determining protein MreD
MRRVWAVTAVAFVAGVVADLLLGAQPPGYMAAFAFLGCIVIIVASKWLGKIALQRPETYYEEEADA